MLMFSFQRQKTMFSFCLVHFLLLLLIPHYVCPTILSFRCEGPNEMSISERNSENIFSCSLRVVLNLTGVSPDQNLPESLSNTSNIPTEIANVRNPSTTLPLEDFKSRDSFSAKSNRIGTVSKYNTNSSDLLSVQVFEDNNDNTKPSRKILEEKELIKNPDFEHNLNGWTCYHCRARRVTGGYRSKYAAKIINTGNQIGSLRTSIRIEQGRYYFTAYVKLLNPPNEKILYSKVVSFAKIHRGSKPIYSKLGETDRVQPNTRWYKVGGDVYVPKDATYMEVYVIVRNIRLSYLIDQASCTRIDPVPNWKEETDRRIKEIRKANIEVRLNVTSMPKGYKLKITQTKQKFKWGAAVKTWLINNPHYHKFHEFIYENFNWAVIENGLKWIHSEREKGRINLSAAKRTVDLLLKNNLHVRGHTLFYGLSDPGWVKHLKGNDLLQALETRINSVMTPFENKLSIWDVSNENLRSSTYEILTHDPNITQKMFVMAHEKDPSVRLFFNENMIVNYRFSTVALGDRASMYVEAGLPLHGIGIQSHMKGNIDIFVVMRRLDEVAKAGLPIFISELTYEDKNVQHRVLSYEQLLRIYFSHPAVEGIMFWTVWSNNWRPTAALLDRHFNVNEVGKLFLSLKTEWSTSPIEYDLSEPVKKFSVFLGEYQAALIKSGQTIWEKSLKIERSSSTTTLVIGAPRSVNEVGKLFLSLKTEWSTSPIEYDLSEPVKKFSVFLGEYQAALIKSGQTIWEKSLKIERSSSTTTLVIGAPRVLESENETEERVWRERRENSREPAEKDEQSG